MRVILLNDTANLGKKGELKDVANGYAQNFLLPKKLAEIATPEAVERQKQTQKKIQEDKKELEENLKKAASKIQNKKIVLRAKAGKEKLFGSIGRKEIFSELKRQNFEIKEESILLKDPIKKIGEFEVDIDLGKNVKTKITVAIEKA
jgi:large subunit ribosomal protein L9